mmetsp:Transcript_25388/g.38808  ORF Transcript_25388/g.38808 Transcript_25388/m.38808 type:complete len:107 (-) Transcript_25388:41-361(-)
MTDALGSCIIATACATERSKGINIPPRNMIIIIFHVIDVPSMTSLILIVNFVLVAFLQCLVLTITNLYQMIEYSSNVNEVVMLCRREQMMTDDDAEYVSIASTSAV